MGICLSCGDAFEQVSRGRPRKYCRPCVGNGYRRTGPWTGADRTCKGCGRTFTPRNVRQAYCESACKERHRASGRWAARVAAMEARAPRRPCAHCGKPFAYVPKHRVKFCSLGCASRHSWLSRFRRVKLCRIRWAECRCGATYVARPGYTHCRPLMSRNGHTYHSTYRRASHTIVCADCGRSETAKQGVRIYCRQCSEVRRKESDRAQKDRRRARKRRLTVETVYRKRVFERDGWLCQLCRRPLRRDVAVPHPLAPTLDHIIPLARGGEHSYRNVQAAHFICNSRKSDSLLAA